MVREEGLRHKGCQSEEAATKVPLQLKVFVLGKEKAYKFGKNGGNM